MIDFCEKYDVERDQWFLIASVHKKRYAASSVGLKNLNKIFLFGGRTDHNNMMLEEILVFFDKKRKILVFVR